MPRWVAAPLTSLDVTLVFIAQPLTFQLGSPSMPSLRFLTLQIARAQRPQPLRVVKVIHWNKQTAQMQAVRRDMVSSQAGGLEDPPTRKTTYTGPSPSGFGTLHNDEAQESARKSIVAVMELASWDTGLYVHKLKCAMCAGLRDNPGLENEM